MIWPIIYFLKGIECTTFWYAVYSNIMYIFMIIEAFILKFSTLLLCCRDQSCAGRTILRASYLRPYAPNDPNYLLRSTWMLDMPLQRRRYFLCSCYSSLKVLCRRGISEATWNNMIVKISWKLLVTVIEYTWKVIW